MSFRRFTFRSYHLEQRRRLLRHKKHQENPSGQRCHVSIRPPPAKQTYVKQVNQGDVGLNTEKIGAEEMDVEPFGEVIFQTGRRRFAGVNFTLKQLVAEVLIFFEKNLKKTLDYMGHLH